MATNENEIMLLYENVRNLIAENKYALAIETTDQLHALLKNEAIIPIEIRAEFRVLDNEAALTVLQAWCRDCKNKLQQRLREDESRKFQ